MLIRSGAVALVAVMLAAAGGASQIAVSPLVIESQGEVTIANSGESAIRVSVEVVDFDQAPDGTPAYSPLGTGPRTCGARVQVGPELVMVRGKSSERLRVALEEGPACWGAVRIGFARDTAFRHFVIVKFYGTSPGGTRGADILSIGPDARDGARAVKLTVRGTGSLATRPRGRLEFRRTTDGAVVASVEVPDFGVHPAQERSIWLRVPDAVPAGSYVVLAVLDAGGADLAAAQTVVEVGGP